MKYMRRISLVIPLLAMPFAQAQDLPDGKGKDLVEQICSGCHGVDTVASQHANKQGWESIVGDMVSRGASATDAQVATIVDYLAANFPPLPPRINVNTATSQEIETGLELTPKEAAAIVQYRQDHGDFKDWDSLTKVAGVDQQKLESKKDRVAFN